MLFHVVKQLMDMTADITNCISFTFFKEKYPKDSVTVHLWTFMNVVYPTITNFVTYKLILLATTCLCETRFNAMCM